MIPHVPRAFLERAFRRVGRFLAAPSTDVEELFGARLACLDSGLGLFRLVHLVDAFEKAGRPRTVLSVGSGGGLHEGYLAARDPACRVTGADLRRQHDTPPLPNLRLEVGNLLDADFRRRLGPAELVYSIECLEHIEEDGVVLDAMAGLVPPGGWLYLQLPFASEVEQADPVLRRRELENHEHVRPGYAAAQLRSMVESRGLDVVAVAGAFWNPLQPMVWAASERFGREWVERHWRDLVDVAALDLRDALPANRGEATAIKVLARKPGLRDVGEFGRARNTSTRT